jgi:hypothetical protein
LWIIPKLEKPANFDIICNHFMGLKMKKPLMLPGHISQMTTGSYDMLHELPLNINLLKTGLKGLSQRSGHKPELQHWLHSPGQQHQNTGRMLINH